MDPIMFPDEIPLPPEEIPLPPDETPIPSDGVPLRPDEIPLPPDDNIPLPPDEPEPVTSHPSQHQKRPHSPFQDANPKKSRTEDGKKRKKANKSKAQLENMDERPTEEQIIMSRLMGFSAFNSTKGKMVPDNQHVGAVHVIKKQRCRQYMNRKGGFNRPLDKTS